MNTEPKVNAGIAIIVIHALFKKYIFLYEAFLIVNLCDIKLDDH